MTDSTPIMPDTLINVDRTHAMKTAIYDWWSNNVYFGRK